MNACRMGAAGLAVWVLAVGCAPAPSDSLGSSATASLPAVQPEGLPTRAGPLGALTAYGVVKGLNDSGLEVQNPIDTTDRECRAIGCLQSIVTDRVRIRSFEETGQAQKYAGESGARQVETVVVTFAPVVPDAERERYWAQIVELVTKG